MQRDSYRTDAADINRLENWSYWIIPTASFMHNHTVSVPPVWFMSYDSCSKIHPALLLQVATDRQHLSRRIIHSASFQISAAQSEVEERRRMGREEKRRESSAIITARVKEKTIHRADKTRPARSRCFLVILESPFATSVVASVRPSVVTSVRPTVVPSISPSGHRVFILAK